MKPAAFALLDEYQRAIADLKAVVARISTAQLVAIADADTKDPDCRSIQTVLTHTVQAGYNYAVCIRKHKGENLAYYTIGLLPDAEAYLAALDEMWEYNKKTLNDYPKIVLCQKNNDKKMVTRWGQMYDVEQLLEHAIVHILRHRRQIERFLAIIGSSE